MLSWHIARVATGIEASSVWQHAINAGNKKRIKSAAFYFLDQNPGQIPHKLHAKYIGILLAPVRLPFLQRPHHPERQECYRIANSAGWITVPISL